MSDAGGCVRCHAKLHTLAAFCNRCGLVVTRKAQSGVPEDLRRIADCQRLLLQVTLLYFIAQGALFAAHEFPLMVTVIVGVIWLLLLALLMTCVLSLTSALRLGAGVSVILTTLCLLPIANLIISAGLCARAASELRIVGIRPGILGAKKQDLEMLVYVHRCRSCGYDLRGLTSLKCPECGMAFAAPAMAAAS